jgi:hypothetical protein
MMPDWFAVVDRAYGLLRKGGVIGVVDSFISRPHAESDAERRLSNGYSASKAAVGRLVQVDRLAF